MNKLIQTVRAQWLSAAILGLAVAALPAMAQDAANNDQAIEIVRQGIPHDALYAIEISGEHGVAVGAFGLMLETSDGGGTWTVIPPKTPKALLGVARAGDYQIVVGQQGLVMTRTAGGEWTMVDTDFDQRLLNVGMNTSGLTVGVGEFGFITVSRDAGATWQGVTIDWEQHNEEGYEPHLYDAVVDEAGTILIAGEFGLILRSTDGGATFAGVNAGDESVFDMYMARDGSASGFAVGQEGLILRTNDSGLTWQRLEADTKANLLGVWAGNSEVVITGIRQMLRSSDDGATFTTTPDAQIIRTWFQGVAAGVSETPAGEKGFLRQQSVYIVGHQATIARVIK